MKNPTDYVNYLTTKTLCDINLPMKMTKMTRRCFLHYSYKIRTMLCTISMLTVWRDEHVNEEFNLCTNTRRHLQWYSDEAMKTFTLMPIMITLE